MKKWIAIIIVVAGLAALGMLIVQRAGKVQEAREQQRQPVVLPPASVKVEPAVTRDFVSEITASGEVKANRVVYVFAKVGGRVEELPVGLGDTVKAGQLLARVEENDLGWRERQGTAGERAAAAMVRQAATQVDVVKVEVDRARKLHEEGVLPEAELIRAEGQLKAAQAALAAAQAQVEVARAGSGLAKEARSWTLIESPIDGVITRKMTELGATVGGQPPQPLFELQDQSSLIIKVDVPAKALDAMKLGAIVEFEVEERPGRRFAAMVKAVGKSLDPQTRRVQVELEVDGKVVGEGVLPAMLATVYIKTDERPNLVAVPRSAVVALAEGPVVFAVRDGKAVKAVPDIAAGDRTHVPVSGLSPGDQVVVAGQDALREGVAVKVARDEKPPTAGEVKPAEGEKGATP